MRTAVVMLSSIGLTALTIAALEGLLGFPPLVLLFVPVALCVRLFGITAGLLTAAVAAAVGDFLFVQPVREVTVHAEGLRLLVALLIGSWLVSIANRRKTASSPRR